MANYSRQREAVLGVLTGTKSHPDAAWVYSETRKLIPNISLGTVYRNLAKLQESGEIVSLGVYGGVERFDADVKEHLHFYCKNCHKIIDINEKQLLPIKKAEKLLGAEIESVTCVFEGKCNDCLNQKNNLA